MNFNSENIDVSRFADALARVAFEEKLSEGFTVYSEGSVHKAIKLYLEPRAEHHEVPLCGGVADIYNDYGVFEVQTGSTAPLLPKLSRLLPEYKVTLVHPFPIRTAHRWLDRESGEISAPKGRGGARSPYSIGRILYPIRELIGKPNFSVLILAYECDEYRVLDGWDRSRKRGATLLGKIPTRLVGEMRLAQTAEYKVLLPDTLGQTFTAKEYMQAIKSRSRYDAVNLKLLSELGIINLAGKQGRAFLYERVEKGQNVNVN